MSPLWLLASLFALGMVVGDDAATGSAPVPTAPVPTAPVPTAPVPTADAKWLDFDAYPGARKLCYQHVSGNTMHIMWTGYATTDPHPKVIDFYVKRYGGKPEKDTLTLSGSKGVRLSVHPAQAGGYPTCEVKPAKTDKTVIIVSKAVGAGVK